MVAAGLRADVEVVRPDVGDRQTADLLAAGLRRDDLYIDHGISGALAARPALDRALDVVSREVGSILGVVKEEGLRA